MIGPNGAGKTSLFNCISGFYRPQQGAILFDGRDISRLHPPERARLGLARTFQNIALFRGMTVLDNIKLGRHVHMRTGVLDGAALLGPRRARGDRDPRRDRGAHHRLSRDQPHPQCSRWRRCAYGLRKRVELARALAMKPKVLMLDEPVAGMNREETEDMARFILDVKEEWGVTILMVEHDMGLVMDISDHVVVLNFGQVIASGKPADVTANPDVIRAYLGSGDVGQLRARIAGRAA